jgi:hypothetical protein
MAMKDQDSRGVANHWMTLIMRMDSHRPGVSLGTGVVRLDAQLQYSPSSSGRGGPNSADEWPRRGCRPLAPDLEGLAAPSSPDLSETQATSGAQILTSRWLGE